MCTVRIEILTEADIVKHVHVHREAVPHAKVLMVETVETSETAHFTRSHAKPKPDRTTRHPRGANQNVDYTNLESADEDSQIPTSKHKQLSRPRREPSSSRNKSDSFTTKQPIVRSLCRSSRLTTLPDISLSNSAADVTPAKPVPKSLTPSTSTDGTSKGTFTTQSYRLRARRHINLVARCVM